MTDACSNHPEAVLFAHDKALPALAPCEHYAGSRRYMEKALRLQQELGPVFDLTCDCEDGAIRGEEQAQVKLIVEMLRSKDNRFFRVGVRIHDVTSSFWEKEIRSFLKQAGDVIPYITLPKARNLEDVRLVLDFIKQESTSVGLEAAPKLHVLIETPGALHQVWDIAALPGIEVLDFGLMDFVSSHLGAISAENMRSPGQFEHPLIVKAKTEIVSAALAHGIVPSHNVTIDFKDPEIAYADAKQARESFGFLRMWSVYPAQIEAIVRAMLPCASELERAGRVLLEAQAADWGPIKMDGELLDRASYRYHWGLLKQAVAGGAEVQNEVRQAFFPEA